MEVVLVCFRQNFVNEVGSHIFLSLRLRCFVVDIEVHDVVQVSDPCVGLNYEQAEISCRSHHFAICPRLK